MQKIISFDVWDTLIKRKCHPEEIKLFTAKYMLLKYDDKIIDKYKDIYVILKERNIIEKQICDENKQKGFDDECRIIDVFDMLQEKIFYKKEKSIAEELLHIEIEHEKKVIYVNKEALDIIKKYESYKMYCISDFYMGKESIKEILNSIDELKDKFEDIYSSADYLLNKKSGNLYKKFEKNLGISPNEHIHVGDNVFSDIEVAKKIGIETIEIKKYGNYEFSPYRKRKFNWNLEALKIKKAISKEDRLYNVGVELSPLLYFFIGNLVEYGIKKNIPKIYYQTREGETFIKIHELIANDNFYEMKLPSSEILEVSRVSTFAASLNEISISELLRLWSQYKKQSLMTIFKTLNIDIKKYESIIKKYDIDENEKIDEPWFNIKFQELFMDKEFSQGINEELNTKRKALKTFFESKNIFDDDKPLFVVDLGWRGTIQDNLAYIYPKKKIMGYYYVLYDFYNVQPKNTRKIAFIEDKKVRDEYIAPMITLFEMLFNPESGSVVAYDGNKAIRKVKENEYNTVKNITSHIQRGMLEGSKKINEYLKFHPYMSDEFYEYICELIKQLKEKPSNELVEAYYSLVHNDTFGTGEYVDKRQNLSIWNRMNLIKCRDLSLKEDWKEAFFIHNNTKMLKFILNFKAKLRKMRGR